MAIGYGMLGAAGFAAMLATSLAWSSEPPGLHPVDVPQFVAVTFDDNFVSGLGDPTGGMTWATDFLRSLNNPVGSSLAATFDGTPVRTSFYDNCLYLQDEGTRESWATAAEDGHEIANHTVSHLNGGSFTAQAWTDEIAPCTAALSNPEGGVGIAAAEVRGFRAPFLAYSAELFGALTSQGLEYDTSIQSCWGVGQDGSNCAWPYTLDQGSPDANDLTVKFAAPSVPPSAALWEVSVSALFVPPDELAAQYGIAPGLRGRIPSDMPAPSYYEPTTGRIAPLDITLFVDAGLGGAEVLATLKYTLDLRLSGNRAPLVFIAHTHVYASNYGAAPHALNATERQGAIEDFVEYALSKPMVRMRPAVDILTWMRAPAPLGGVVTMPLGGSGGGGGGSVAGGAPGSVTAAGGGAGTLGGQPLSAGGSPAAGAGGAAPDLLPPTGSSSQLSCDCRVVGPARGAPAGLSALLSLVAGAVARRRFRAHRDRVSTPCGKKRSCLRAGLFRRN